MSAVTEQACELLELVEHIREACPDMPLQHAIALAVAAQQNDLLNDAVIVLGDIADALNDMRPTPTPGRLH